MKGINKSSINTLFVFLLSMFLMVIYLFIQNYKYRNELQNMDNDMYSNKKLISENNDLIKSLLLKSNLTYQLNGVKMSSLININKEDGDSISFKKLIGLKPKLVFRSSEIHCQICVDQEIENIKSVVDLFDESDILILSSYSSYRNLGIFKRINQIQIPIYNIKDLGLNLEKRDLPYYFVIDSSMIIKDVMIPDKYLPKNSLAYLSIIKNKYFE